MSLQAVKSVLDRAHDDDDFRKKLLENPDDILKEFDLTENERAKFKSMKSEQLVAFKNNLDQRISKDGGVGNVDDDWWVDSVTD